ncbi:OpgC domain-containing protein [Aquabacterium sp. A7-Y]|uniref:OpgC domain-containing protein n=1 Tax=Aquabacterium sp. A7-Y TaxID=1349605 RepID=UPI00223CEA5A|nr:OpgC domain-containing protein [Aquabacterium sp. A7-Y]MCW7538739.1 OpgC domain-containing protein [Aquabacterium sp. A7-Y]
MNATNARAGAPSSVPRGRDTRLDLIRGLAVLTITLNHQGALTHLVGRDGRDVPTLTHLGYSSAAELFFLLSGYLIGKLYLSRDQEGWWVGASKRVMERSLKLYMWNGVLFLLLAAIVLFGPHALRQATNYHLLASDGLRAVAEFALLYRRPKFLDILQVYCLFMWTAPLLFLVLRISARLALLLLVLPYVLVQIDPTLLPLDSRLGGAFHPFAWQLVFFGGMLAGRLDLLGRFTRWLEDKPQRAAWLLALLLGSFVLCRVDRSNLLLGAYFDMPGVDKRTAGPVRLLHAVLVLLTLLALPTRWPAILSHPLARMVSNVGAHSLHAFCASIVLNYLAALMWLARPADSTYFALAFGSLALLLLLGQVLTAWKRPAARAPAQTALAPAPAAAPAPPAAAHVAVLRAPAQSQPQARRPAGREAPQGGLA